MTTTMPPADPGGLRPPQVGASGTIRRSQDPSWPPLDLPLPSLAGVLELPTAPAPRRGDGHPLPAHPQAPAALALPDLVTRHPARGHRATAVFVAQWLGIVVAALGAIGAFGWLMDPWGAFAHGGPAPLVQPDQRADKVAMLARRDNPDVVLLGSSRMLRYDPAVVTRGSHRRGFNASVAGSDVLDAAAITSWLAERHRAGHGPMPHVVYGLGVEELRPQPSGAVLDRVPELARQRRPETVPFHLVSAATAADLRLRWAPLLSLGTLRASLESAGRELSGGPPPIDRRFRTRWADDGMQLRGHDDATVQHGRAGWNEVRVFRRQYLGFYERRTVGAELPADARAQLEHLLAVANAEGDAPTLFLLPMRTGLAQELGPIGRDAQTQLVRRYLSSLHGRYRFRWRDLSDGPAPGDPERGWYDDVHPRISTARIVLAALRHELGAAELRGDATAAARA